MDSDNNSAETETRPVLQITKGLPATDGAGVRMTRIIGTSELDHVDPFLLFDVFETENPDDYIAGFPPHPHRGFETVTYMLAGQMRHKDNAGNEGVIKSGGVQWMTAGRGIIHSEIPEQQDGLMWGTQLWVNLPGEQKMTEPDYQEYDASDIPVEDREDGGKVKVVAGTSSLGTAGPVQGRAVEPLYLDVSLPPGTAFSEPLPVSHQVFVFVIEGSLRIGEQRVAARTMAILGSGTHVSLASADENSRFLMVAGRELSEPIARGGPFVMNTKEEIRQAFNDYKSGRF
jgi:redox-sensitive bicupin YhaK (pirin superfamily)